LSPVQRHPPFDLGHGAPAGSGKGDRGRMGCADRERRDDGRDMVLRRGAGMASIDQKFVSPLAQAKGLGSTGEGVHTWLIERASAAFLIPLTAWLVWSVMDMRGASYAEFTAWLALPWNATL